MDGSSSLNLIYADTIKKMGINAARIKPTSRTKFKGIIPGAEARPSGKITLDVVFGTPENYRLESLEFEVVPFQTGYQALLGRAAFVQFQAVPLCIPEVENARAARSDHHIRRRQPHIQS